MILTYATACARTQLLLRSYYCIQLPWACAPHPDRGGLYSKPVCKMKIYYCGCSLHNTTSTSCISATYLEHTCTSLMSSPTMQIRYFVTLSDTFTLILSSLFHPRFALLGGILKKVVMIRTFWGFDILDLGIEERRIYFVRPCLLVCSLLRVLIYPHLKELIEYTHHLTEAAGLRPTIPVNNLFAGRVNNGWFLTN